jgi:pimeloyl-ACP methyl ester carboxylesterase
MPSGVASDLASHTVDSGGVRLHCVTSGPPAGPMVLLLHGFPARWSTWRHAMGALAGAGFFAVAPDLRGYGESDKPPGVQAYAVTRIVEDVAAIIQAFGRRSACVAGHDFGGGVAWATAMLRPDLVLRLATLNSVHPVGFQRQMRKWSQLKKSWYVLFFLLPWAPEWYLSRNDFGFVRSSLADDGLSPETIADILEGIRPPGATHAAVNWYRASFRGGLAKHQLTAKVEVPTLVIWGDRDRYLDPELAVPPQELVTRARIEHVPGASHWVQHDAPDRVGKLLIEHFYGG